MDLQNMIEEWRSTLEKNGLKISRSKTVYMCCNFSRRARVDPVLYLKEEMIQNVRDFKYLGSVISCESDIEVDVVNRVKKQWLDELEIAFRSLVRQTNVHRTEGTSL